MITFVKRNHPYGAYWRVLWKGRQAGLIVPVGIPASYILLKVQETGYKELSREPSITAAKQWFLDKTGSQNGSANRTSDAA